MILYRYNLTMAILASRNWIVYSVSILEMSRAATDFTIASRDSPGNTPRGESAPLCGAVAKFEETSDNLLFFRKTPKIKMKFQNMKIGIFKFQILLKYLKVAQILKFLVGGFQRLSTLHNYCTALAQGWFNNMTMAPGRPHHLARCV